MFKKLLIVLALFAGFAVAGAGSAEAGYFVRRVAPVRRAVLPPYPIARRAVVAPVYRPVVRRPIVHRPVVYGPAYAMPYYAPGVSVVVGFERFAHGSFGGPNGLMGTEFLVRPQHAAGGLFLWEI